MRRERQESERWVEIKEISWWPVIRGKRDEEDKIKVVITTKEFCSCLIDSCCKIKCG